MTNSGRTEPEAQRIVPGDGGISGGAIHGGRLTGNAAREWTDGWKKGFGELVARTGEIALPSSAAEMRVRLAAHRPDDIPPEQRERKPTQNKVKPPKNAKAIWY